MLLLSVAILAALAAFAPLLVRLPRGLGVLLTAVAVFALGGWFAMQVPAAVDGEFIRQSHAWVPGLDVNLSFRLDGLGLIFALLICFIGGLVILYASSYMRGHKRAGVFFAELLGFMASMLGLVLADNVFLLFAFWELTSATSFLLIGFDAEREKARNAARTALLVTGVGGLAMLAGLILLGGAAGSYELSEILASPEGLLEHRHYPAIVVLILLGCFSKSAIFPFHFWLPQAMEAPSPVSALLHSSTMVKAGVYLIARLHPALGGTLLWDDALIIFGGVTMVSAAAIATWQPALKRILAYSTVSSLGVLVMMIGMGATKGAAVYLLAHAMFKACLFLPAGSVIKKTGEKDPDRLGGLARAMPITAGATAVGALSLAGMFPLLGFVGKELVLKAGLTHPEWSIAVTVATVVAALLTVYAALLVGYRPFFARAKVNLEKKPHDPDWRQLTGPVLLALGGVVAGFAPALFATPLVRMTMASIEGVAVHEGEIKLAFWKLLWPPTTAMGLSILALVLGVLLYVLRDAYHRIGRPFTVLGRYGTTWMFDRGLELTLDLAALQTRVLQNGSLRSYVRITLLAAGGFVVAALVRIDMLPTVDVAFSALTVVDAMLAIVLIGGAIAVTTQRSALAAIAVLGMVGLTVAVIFLLFSAPDVAMTQLAIETLIVIIFVLVIYHLPDFRHFTRRGERLWDALVAIFFGLAMAGLALQAVVRETPAPISEEQAAKSLTEAYGHNIVNVILVDFRALDTLGEIFVLGVAGVGVFTLLRLRGKPRGERRAA